MVFEKGALLTQREMATESIVGLARAVGERAAPPVYQLAFGRLALFEPQLTNEDPSREWQGDWYLVMKVEDEPRTTPSLEEIRGEVVDAWKLKEAGKLALAKAKELAEELKESTTDLRNFFDVRNYETLTTDMFSRLEFPTGPGQGQAPRLSADFGLEKVGADFLDRVFNAKGDEPLAMLNFDQTIAYVVRVRQRQRGPDEMRSLFVTEANSWPGMQETITIRRQRFNAELNERIRTAVELEYDEQWLARLREMQ